MFFKKPLMFFYFTCLHENAIITYVCVCIMMVVDHVTLILENLTSDWQLTAPFSLTTNWCL